MQRMLGWWGRLIVVGTVLTGLAGARGVAAQAPTRTLQVLVRTPAGQGVPDLMITLVPQPAALGGPVGVPPPAASGLTDRTGQATFQDLRAGMWRVQLAGTVAGMPVQPVAEQARPPYGRVAAGGGFPLPVNLGDEQEEGGAAAGPTPVAAVQQALLVGQPRGGVWVPELDLGDPAASPIPISALPTPVPALTGVPTLDVRATVAPTAVGGSSPPRGATPGAGSLAAEGAPAVGSAPPGPPAAPLPVTLSPLTLCYAIPIGVGLLVVLGSFWRRRRAGAPATTPALRETRPTIAAAPAERESDRHV